MSDNNSQDANQMTGAAMIVRALADHGVQHIFGYPGGAVLPIYDEIFQQSDVEVTANGCSTSVPPVTLPKAMPVLPVSQAWCW